MHGPQTHAAPPRRLVANDVELHVVERGNGGDPVVFVHGGLSDYRYWNGHLDAFAARHHAVAYSRRYAYPNYNPRVPTYSALTDSHDLAALIDALGLGPVHLVGASKGGVAALFLALRHPELVRSLVLAEPPVLRWATSTHEGQREFEIFMAMVWRPAADAFRRGDARSAVTAFIEYFLGPGAFERLPDRTQRRILQDAADLEAQVLSTAPFPEMDRARVASLRMPVLLLSGTESRRVHALVDAELARLLPHAERHVVDDASHDVWADAPEECREATLAFLARRFP